MTVWMVPGRVKRVVDGDTLIVDLDLGWGLWKLGARVRLSGIDAPELGTPAGEAAQQFTGWLLRDLEQEQPWAYSSVTVVSRSLDKYGRTLAAVRLADGRVLNDLILDAGHAVKA